MSNASHYVSDLQSRADDLWDQYERLEFSGTLNLILQEANRASGDEEADTSELEYLLGTVGDLLGWVRSSVLGALVLAEETWDGMDNAPADYVTAYQSLEVLRGEAELMWRHAKALSSGAKFS